MKNRFLSIVLCLVLVISMPMAAFAHSCVDKNRDYWCDECGMYISHKCSDPDKDGWCNLCDCWIIHTCADKNADSLCDVCSKLMDVKVHVKAESYVLPDRDVQMVIYPRQTVYTKSVNVYGNPAQYSFQCQAQSSFQLSVSKYGHPTRTFSYSTTTEDIYINTTLYPYGDATQDGKVNVADTSLIYACVKGTASLEDDYAKECADVNYDNNLNIADVSKVYAHVKGTTLLW